MVFFSTSDSCLPLQALVLFAGRVWGQARQQACAVSSLTFDLISGHLKLCLDADVTSVASP